MIVYSWWTSFFFKKNYITKLNYEAETLLGLAEAHIMITVACVQKFYHKKWKFQLLKFTHISPYIPLETQHF